LFLKNEKKHFILNKNIKKFISQEYYYLNFDKIRQTRNRNFIFFHSIFKNKNELKINLKNINGPQYYPLLIKNGNYLRKFLNKKMIYNPFLWKEVINRKVKNNKKFVFEKYISKNCVFLPVDEKLTIKNLKYIANETKNSF